MLISLLKDTVEPKTDQEIEIIDMIAKSTNNLSNIIDELSDISRIESEIGEFGNVKLKDLIGEVEMSIKALLENSNAQINLDLKEPEIPFSKKNLRSILINLIGNAIKYRSPDRTPDVTIRTEKSDGFIVMSVEDNGIGIKEDNDEIFAKFKRAHHHVEGSGVGLYLIKKLITNSGGDIEVESEVGKGSVFKVYFKADSSGVDKDESENSRLERNTN